MFDQNYLALALSLVLFGVKIGALVDCVARGDEKFVLIDTLPRRSWIIILILAILAHAFVSRWNPIGFFSLVGTVAALVYLALLRGTP